MNHVSHMARRSGGWGWFVVRALLGSAAALGTASLGPLLLLPTALVQYSSAATPSPSLGPRPTTCWHSSTASGCDQHLNPLPRLVLGIVLVAAGFVAHANRS